MTINGRLVSNTAIVKRFQTEKKSTRVSGSLPVRILQPHVVLANHSGGAIEPRKCVMISLSASIQYRRVTDIQTRYNCNSRAYA